jgi:hypothetical protein
MPSDVESPMYTTASHEVRVAGVASCDSGLCEAAFCESVFVDAALGDFVVRVGEESGVAAGAWCVESLISSGAFA